jgi:hypothetical protein
MITILNVIVGVYLFIVANILFWGGILNVFAFLADSSRFPFGPWEFVSFLLNILWAILLVVGTILFFLKGKKKYNYGLVVLGIIWLETLIYRLFHITHFRLEMTDLYNTLFFGIPFVLILLARHWEKKN